MVRLISLELRRNRLGPYRAAGIICGVALLVFRYFMAFIPIIDPSDPDSGLFGSYDFLTNITDLLGLSMFSILGGVMGSKFVIEEYQGSRAILLFSYPVSRKKILGAKVVLVFLYTSGTMLLCGFAVEILFFAIESVFPVCSGNLTWGTVLTAFASLLCYCLLAGAAAVLSICVGFAKRSVSVTIVASVVMAVMMCQALSMAFACPAVIYIALGVTTVAVIPVVRDMLRRVENLEI